ncbi:hypothetical protein GVX82_02550 [Patescibacteria group bacterium]|nr:hypothetical protein [Patescibacteria group bacterium]
MPTTIHDRSPPHEIACIPANAMVTALMFERIGDNPDGGRFDIAATHHEGAGEL